MIKIKRKWCIEEYCDKCQAYNFGIIVDKRPTKKSIKKLIKKHFLGLWDADPWICFECLSKVTHREE